MARLHLQDRLLLGFCCHQVPGFFNRIEMGKWTESYSIYVPDEDFGSKRKAVGILSGASTQEVVR